MRIVISHRALRNFAYVCQMVNDVFKWLMFPANATSAPPEARGALMMQIPGWAGDHQSCSWIPLDLPRRSLSKWHHQATNLSRHMSVFSILRWLKNFNDHHLPWIKHITHGSKIIWMGPWGTSLVLQIIHTLALTGVVNPSRSES